jgi:DNA-binding NtrC family response regulator
MAAIGVRAAYRVLVLERASNIRRVVGQLLGDEGLEVIAADHSDAALVLARTEKPAVILIELASEADLVSVRQLASEATTHQLIVIGPYGRAPLAVEALAAGASAYILKPLSRDELIVLVHKAIEQFELAEEVAALRRELASTRSSTSDPSAA